jgi:hypothetical protein
MSEQEYKDFLIYLFNEYVGNKIYTYEQSAFRPQRFFDVTYKGLPQLKNCNQMEILELIVKFTLNLCYFLILHTIQ